MKSGKKQHIKPPTYSNLSKEEQKAVKDLQERDHIEIVNADEAGAVVIIDLCNSIEKSERELNNKEHYRQLSKDQTAANNETVNIVIEKRSRRTRNYFTLGTQILDST